MYTCSSYYSEAISHKMARICSTFKSSAIYPEQKGKVLSPRKGRGGRKLQLPPQRANLITVVIWGVLAESHQLEHLWMWWHFGGSVVFGTAREHLPALNGKMRASGIFRKMFARESQTSNSRVFLILVPRKSGPESCPSQGLLYGPICCISAPSLTHHFFKSDICRTQ